MTSTDTSALADVLGATFAGAIITPGDERYDAARAVWNATIDARPALIARCRTAGDIVAALDLARSAGSPWWKTYSPRTRRRVVTSAASGSSSALVRSSNRYDLDSPVSTSSACGTLPSLPGSGTGR